MSRIENGLVAIDFDVDDKRIVKRLLAELAKIAPNVHARAPRRRGSGFKLALFARLAKGEETLVGAQVIGTSTPVAARIIASKSSAASHVLMAGALDNSVSTARSLTMRMAVLRRNIGG